MSKEDGDAQRKSSLNTNLINATMDPRKRVEKNNATIRSPSSTDGSARSTPQPQPLQQTAVMIASTEKEDDATKKLLIDSLAAFTSRMTADASLRVSYDLARSQLETATAQYKNMQSHFEKYPAIKEQTSADKSKAAVQVAKLDLRLKESMASQSKLTMSVSQAIFDLFSRAEAAPRLPEPQLDVVSREDYEALQDRFQKQQDLLYQHQDRFEKQASMIEKLDKTVKEVSEASNQTKSRSSITERALGGDITALKTRIQKVEASEESDKRSLRDLAATVSSHANDISLVRSDLVQNKLNLAAKEDSLDTVSRTAKSAASSAATVREDLSKIERQLPPIKNELGQIWSEINEPGKESVLKRFKKHDQTINNLWTKVEYIEKPVEPARIKILENRVEHLTEHLSDLRGDFERNAAAAVPLSAASPVSVGTPRGFDSDAFKQEVVDEATALVGVLSEGHDEHTAIIEGLQEKLGLLSIEVEKSNHDHADKFRQLEALNRLSNDSASAKYASIEKAVADSTSKTEMLRTDVNINWKKLQTEVHTNWKTIESLDRASNDKHALASAACESIEKTIAGFKSKTDTLQSDLESLSEMVISLQKRPSPSVSPANGIDARQFRPLPPTSPGPTQTNGFHTTAPQHLTNGASAVPNNSRTAVTPDQIEAIWGSIHSLRQRFDNLTTEEVVKAMVDQSTKMFPAAKEFQAAVNILQNVDKDLVGRLGSLDMRLGSLTQNINNLRGEFKNYATAQLGHNLDARLQKVQLDLAAAGNSFTQLSKEVNDKLDDAQNKAQVLAQGQTTAINNIELQVNAFAEDAFGKENE
jgi:ribosomal protein S15P/S13E